MSEPVFCVEFTNGSLGKYMGMGKDVIEGLLQGKEYKFIAEEEYQSKLKILNGE